MIFLLTTLLGIFIGDLANMLYPSKTRDGRIGSIIIGGLGALIGISIMNVQRIENSLLQGVSFLVFASLGSLSLLAIKTLMISSLTQGDSTKMLR